MILSELYMSKSRPSNPKNKNVFKIQAPIPQGQCHWHDIPCREIDWGWSRETHTETEKQTVDNPEEKHGFALSLLVSNEAYHLCVVI